MMGRCRGAQGKPWTLNEDVILNRMRTKEDYDWRQIADSLNRTREACKCRYKVIGRRFR